ncbi:MAG: hypothetical protein NT027_13610 [Proteobacteria bacterium]|nr:hypothetical protein [Pseudomonadota bacterium]
MLNNFKGFYKFVGMSWFGLFAAMSQSAFSQSLQFSESGFSSSCGAQAQIGGGSMDLYFPNLVINNPMELSSRTNCNVRAAARIAPGYYISKLTTNVTASVLKSRGARGSISIRSSFFGFMIAPFSIDLPAGQEINEEIQRSSTLHFNARTTPAWVSNWCSPRRTSSGLYQLTMAISGQKQRATDDLVIGIENFSISEGMDIELSPCSL